MPPAQAQPHVGTQSPRWWRRWHTPGGRRGRRAVAGCAARPAPAAPATAGDGPVGAAPAPAPQYGSATHLAGDEYCHSRECKREGAHRSSAGALCACGAGRQARPGAAEHGVAAARYKRCRRGRERGEIFAGGSRPHPLLMLLLAHMPASRGLTPSPASPAIPVASGRGGARARTRARLVRYLRRRGAWRWRRGGGLEASVLAPLLLAYNATAGSLAITGVACTALRLARAHRSQRRGGGRARRRALTPFIAPPPPCPSPLLHTHPRPHAPIQLAETQGGPSE